MVDRGFDQADGLRRMFGGSRTRVLEIVAGAAGVGRTSVAVNLGAALARAGRNTLLLDFVADAAGSRVRRHFGLRAQARDAGSGAQLHAVADGYRVATLSHRDWMQSGPLSAAALRVEGDLGAGSPDWVLVNGAGVEPIVLNDDHLRDVLIVLSTARASITDAYGLLKRMAAVSRACRYRVVVNRVHSDEAARRICRNMAEVARSHLGVALEYGGFIAADAAIERAAAECASVIDCAPASPAAQSFVRLADALGSTFNARPTRFGRTSDNAVALGAA